MKIAWVTERAAPDVAEDDAEAVALLHSQYGVAVDAVPWDADEEATDWSHYRLVVIRSCWYDPPPFALRGI